MYRATMSIRTTRGVFNLFTVLVLSGCVTSGNTSTRPVAPGTPSPAPTFAHGLPPASPLPSFSPQASCVLEFGYQYAESSQFGDSCRATILTGAYRDFGYSVVYPRPWSLRLAGADADNLVFNEDISSGTRQELFIMAISTNLPLDQADTATYSYELSGPWRVVSEGETVVARPI